MHYATLGRQTLLNAELIRLRLHCSWVTKTRRCWLGFINIYRTAQTTCVTKHGKRRKDIKFSLVHTCSPKLRNTGRQNFGPPSFSFVDDIFSTSCAICDCAPRGCVRNDRHGYDCGQHGSQSRWLDCVRRERRGCLPSDHAGFQSRICSASLAKRERLVS